MVGALSEAEGHVDKTIRGEHYNAQGAQGGERRVAETES